mmetsp:Transcript_99284/g.286481  ORF Transcript_99284/g.286481 Transcript_99284/m.286481 type:complete len:407 (-) Transcript_99284:222-1442(-)
MPKAPEPTMHVGTCNRKSSASMIHRSLRPSCAMESRSTSPLNNARDCMVGASLAVSPTKALELLLSAATASSRNGATTCGMCGTCALCSTLTPMRYFGQVAPVLVMRRWTFWAAPPKRVTGKHSGTCVSEALSNAWLSLSRSDSKMTSANASPKMVLPKNELTGTALDTTSKSASSQTTRSQRRSAMDCMLLASADCTFSCCSCSSKRRFCRHSPRMNRSKREDPHTEKPKIIARTANVNDKPFFVTVPHMETVVTQAAHMLRTQKMKRCARRDELSATTVTVQSNERSEFVSSLWRRSKSANLSLQCCKLLCLPMHTRQVIAREMSKTRNSPVTTFHFPVHNFTHEATMANMHEDRSKTVHAMLIHRASMCIVNGSSAASASLRIQSPSLMLISSNTATENEATK